jgi:hypothetical protein
MVMLGLKSASYWTHSAATAASCAEEKSNPNGSTQQDDHEAQGGCHVQIEAALLTLATAFGG